MALGLQEVEAPSISKQSAHECAKVVNSTTGRLYLQEIFLVLISVRVLVDPTVIVRLEELSQRLH